MLKKRRCCLRFVRLNLNLNNSLKSLIIWQSMETLPQSAIQLMCVRHHNFSEITSACLLLLLCGRPVRGGATYIKGSAEDDVIDFYRGSAVMQFYWVVRRFFREFHPRNYESWFEKSQAFVPESYDRNAATSPFLRSPPCLVFYLVCSQPPRTPPSWQRAAPRTEMLCVRHLKKQSYIMSTQLPTLSLSGYK